MSKHLDCQVQAFRPIWDCVMCQVSQAHRTLWPGSTNGRLLPAFRPPQSGVAVLMWACQKLAELVLQSDAKEAGLSDGTAKRLCTLISILSRRQHFTRHTAESLKTEGGRIATVLQQVLTSAYSAETRSAALEASGAWIKLMADAGTRCAELLSTCLQAVEHGLREATEPASVSAEASVRFCAALGPLAPSPGAVVLAGLECCARRPRPDLVQAPLLAFTCRENSPSLCRRLLLWWLPRSACTQASYFQSSLQLADKCCCISTCSWQSLSGLPALFGDQASQKWSRSPAAIFTSTGIWSKRRMNARFSETSNRRPQKGRGETAWGSRTKCPCHNLLRPFG